jgi:branched-chain amino acid transport system substrate-binding protein
MSSGNGRRRGLSRRTFTTGAAAAGIIAGTSPFYIGRAQGAALKVGVLLPRSGAQASIGQDCQRGVEVAGGILKSLGLPSLEIMNGDTETNVDVARSRAERLISEGAQLLVGAFDSGQSTAIAQVAEQRGIPFVINIAAAPMILGDAFANQLEVFKISGVSPKSAVFMHVNDTFGVAMQKGFTGVISKFEMPYKVLETIAYDPTARDLSVEVSKAKATGAEALIMVSRLNDAILITRELVKQRWNPTAVLSMGPGWYEDQYLKTLAKLSDGPLSFVPWYDPNKKLSKQLEAAHTKAFPDINLNTNHIYTFEALLIAADAYKRAGSADPKALADAIRTTNIKDNVSTGPGIQFDAKGQNDKLKNSAIQNRGGKLVAVAPAAASNAKPELPMTPYDKR